MIVIGLLLNGVIGTLMIINGEGWRGFLQLCVAFLLVVSGITIRRQDHGVI